MPPKRTAECRLPIADCNRRGSPNPNALLRCHEHAVGGLNFKGVVPDIGVPSGTDHAKLTPGMWVAYDLLFNVNVRGFSAPGVCPSERDALIARITVEHPWRLSFERTISLLISL